MKLPRTRMDSTHTYYIMYRRQSSDVICSLQSWNAKADFRIEFLRRKRAGRELPACFLIISTTTQSKEKKTSNVNLTVHVVFILVTFDAEPRSVGTQLKFSSHVLCGSRLMSVWCCAGTWLTGHPEWNLSIDCYNWCWLFVTVMLMMINIFWCDAMMCCYDSSLLLIKSMLISTDDISWWVFVIDAPTHNTYVQQIKTTHRNFNSTISNITQCYTSSMSDTLPSWGMWEY